jgi:hypothetical protein
MDVRHSLAAVFKKLTAALGGSVTLQTRRRGDGGPQEANDL